MSTDPTFAAEVRGLLADSLRVRTQRRLIVITLALGLAVITLVALLLPVDLREYAMFSLPTQLVMSVTLPFVGVVMVHAASRGPRPARLGPVITAALLIAVAVAAFGSVACGLAYAAVGNPDLGIGDPVVTVAGPFLAQLLAQSVGTGLGQLIRWSVVASLATIALPLGLYLLLGITGPLSEARAWLTPLSAAENLLSGVMAPMDWAGWAVIVALWGVGLNAAGALLPKLARRRRPQNR